MIENFDLETLINNNIYSVELLPTLVSFVFCLLASFILRELYITKSFSISGKKQIGSIIPILSMVIFIIIVIIKSSLALSLGLVGALSIVRFRTPIKEPEELIYLFIAIAIGIGFGSGQIVITAILVVIMFLIIFFWTSNNKKNPMSEYNLIINWYDSNISSEIILDEVNKLSDQVKLIRSESL